MNTITKVFAICVAIISFFILYREYDFNNPLTLGEFVLQQVVKSIFTLLLVTLGAALINNYFQKQQKERDEKKAELIKEQEQQRENFLKIQEQERQERQRQHQIRTQIVNKFIEIFSGFYEIQKKYYALMNLKSLLAGKKIEAIEEIKKDERWNKDLNKVVDIESNKEKMKILQELIFEAIEFESAYGALKVEIVENYNLGWLSDNIIKEVVENYDKEIDYRFKSKSISKMKEYLKIYSIPNNKLHIQLELLGECFDYWRKNMEQGKKILDEKEFSRNDIWQCYYEILHFLSTAIIKPLNLNQDNPR